MTDFSDFRAELEVVKRERDEARHEVLELQNEILFLNSTYENSHELMTAKDLKIKCRCYEAKIFRLCVALEKIIIENNKNDESGATNCQERLNINKLAKNALEATSAETVEWLKELVNMLQKFIDSEFDSSPALVKMAQTVLAKYWIEEVST